MLYCSTCNIYSRTTKQHEVHNKTKKHIKMALIPDIPHKSLSKNAKNFTCQYCDFVCCKKGDYNRHILTRKHQIATNSNIDYIQNNNNPSYMCEICSKEYNDRTGLWRHKKNCVLPPTPLSKINPNNNHDNDTSYALDTEIVIDKQTIMAILLQNQEMMTKMMEIMSQIPISAPESSTQCSNV